MPPSIQSRHRFCIAMNDTQGRRYLSARPRFLYRKLADTRIHVVKAGDTLWGLAGIYYYSLPNSDQLWWIIGDFQPGPDGEPDPIHDATIQLVAGREIHVPSVRAVQELIFNERRRNE